MSSSQERFDNQDKTSLNNEHTLKQKKDRNVNQVMSREREIKRRG
jgi:hypothetical protein